jgi:hypothetical protein
VTGEHLSQDIRALLALFSRHRVRFLLVGGEAVIHHGYARLTGDVDFFYDRARLNTQRLYLALADFWGGEVPAVDRAEELEEAELVVQFGRPPNRIDLLSSLGTVDFARAWRRRARERLKLGSRSIELPILSLEDLLQSKRDAGRHKDLDDIEHLSGIKSRRKRRRPTRD